MNTSTKINVLMSVMMLIMIFAAITVVTMLSSMSSARAAVTVNKLAKEMKEGYTLSKEHTTHQEGLYKHAALVVIDNQGAAKPMRSLML